MNDSKPTTGARATRSSAELADALDRVRATIPWCTEWQDRNMREAAGHLRGAARIAKWYDDQLARDDQRYRESAALIEDALDDLSTVVRNADRYDHRTGIEAIAAIRAALAAAEPPTEAR